MSAETAVQFQLLLNWLYLLLVGDGASYIMVHEYTTIMSHKHIFLLLFKQDWLEQQSNQLFWLMGWFNNAIQIFHKIDWTKILTILLFEVSFNFLLSVSSFLQSFFLDFPKNGKIFESKTKRKQDRLSPVVWATQSGLFSIKFYKGLSTHSIAKAWSERSLFCHKWVPMSSHVHLAIW